MFSIIRYGKRVLGPLGLACVAILGGCQQQSSTPIGATLNGAGATDAGLTQTAVKPAPVADLWTRQQGEDWPIFLGPRSDGTSNEKGLDPDLWKPHPRLVWNLPLGMSYGGPAVAKGRLLQFDRNEGKERLRAVEAESGKLLWIWEDPVEYEDMYGYNSGPRCMPTIDGDLVYLYGVSGKLTCVTFADGKLVWQRDLNKEFGVVQNFFGVASTPTIAGERLFVMVGGSPEESHRMPSGRLDMVKPNGTAILALNKLTGKEIYRVGDDLASYSSLRTARLGGREVGLAFVRSGLMAWEIESGKELFKFPWRARKLESVNAAQPIISGDQIFISETYEIGSSLLDLSSGQPKVVWQDGNRRFDQAFRAHWSTPVLIDGHLYGCSGRNQPDCDFRCIQWSDGKVLWTERRHQRASVTAIDGYLIVLYENGELELVRPSKEKYDSLRLVDLNQISLEDGVPMLDEPCWAAPVISHGLMYIRGNSRLLCFDLIPAP